MRNALVRPRSDNGICEHFTNTEVRAHYLTRSSSGNSLYEILNWSLKQLGDRLPAREMDISNRLGDEALARNYLLMRAEYQLGELTDEKLG